jgi:hypothetical protein
VSRPQYGDYQFDIYFDGLEGQLPKYPVDFASVERKAAEVLPRGCTPTLAVVTATRALNAPEKADEALALIYGPGCHTAAVWGSRSP